MSYILEGLYLGGMVDVSDSEQLRRKGVTHILTVDWRPISRERRAGFAYHFVSALDTAEVDLLSHFSDCSSFIEDARKEGGVLVHCQAGQSRSAAVVVAYIMKTMSLSFTEAFSLVSRQRPQISPNSGFLEQLHLFELMGNKVDPSNESYRRHRLSRLAAMMQGAQNPGSAMETDMLSADPAVSGSSESEAGAVFKCRKCRRPLFREGVIMRHPQGRGKEAFTWQGSTIRMSYEEGVEGVEGMEEGSTPCTDSLFTEPVQWMERSILTLEGKLSCPKCQAKLGSFNWAGERCPCGRWITPSFHINNGKVDKCLPRVAPQILQRRRMGAEEDRAEGEGSGDVTSRGEEGMDVTAVVAGQSTR